LSPERNKNLALLEASEEEEEAIEVVEVALVVVVEVEVALAEIKARNGLVHRKIIFVNSY
jgi:hypothetical protein